MTSWEPVDIDHNEIADEDEKWDHDAMNDLEKEFEELRQYNRNFNESHNEVTREEASIHLDVTGHDIEELVANQIYDKLTTNINNMRKKYGIQNSIPIDPIRKNDN